MPRKRSRGFTIIELLVVVAILAILSVIVVPKFIGAIDKSRQSRDLAEINSIEKAVSLYYIDNSEYPVIQTTQPVFGNPENVDFSKIYPTYISKLPHFSYWIVDYQGHVYHEEYKPCTISGSELQLNTNYTYKIYDANGNEALNYSATSVDLTQYSKVIPTDDKGMQLPAITSEFNGIVEHPEAVDTTNTEQPSEPFTFIQEFNYTGDYQTLTIPKTGSYKIEVWGAQGGGGAGGKGGYSYGETTFNAGQNIYIYIGQNPTGINGGWNGGGNSGTLNGLSGQGGGGATDIRLVPGTCDDISSLQSRIIVGGGGGGGNATYNAGQSNVGGNGGGLVGLGGNSEKYGSNSCDKGATQTAGGLGGAQWDGSAQIGYTGRLGVGGNGGKGSGYSYSDGGGGGYYGGGGGGGAYYGDFSGGGGSSYIQGLINANTSAGVQTGNGKAVITYVNR